MSKSFLSRFGQAAKTALWTVPIYVFFNDNLGGIALVDGPSMSPTFNPRQNERSDLVLVNRFSVKLMQKIGVGDVITYRSPMNPHQICVKRLISEGDTFVYHRDFHRSVYVPKGYCWVEGDNHNDSIDSLEYGPIPMALIDGKVSFVVWPPSRFGPVKSLEKRIII